ncbi:DUF2171 domain-containing protein [Sphingomonas panacisoli]|uniref:DUF2171 domain-containing protein n=1 Tax=Sphingomonas panacisoli TaxID=1813879 RepID=A0A5B8LHB1_9SPHN|nr:DUF2171 domain-containing protein [Sphingomonas panacisoli]QDZ07014.1 DUF2171 domain-containing protein [Sphingomonas panacisoli]
MGYERYPRGRSQDDWNRDNDEAAARDYGTGSNPGYGRDDYGERGYYSRNRTQDFASRGGQYGSQYGNDYRTSASDRGYSDYNAIDYGSGYGGNREFQRDRDYGRGAGGGASSGGYHGNLGYMREAQGYDRQNRGFLDRAGDEVRSWFGDDDAERRRQMDAQNARDRDYHTWRSGQIDALDRDYDEYRRENQQKFSNEFGTWRTERQGQRTSLSRVNEHMDVVGSDGEHIGTVDKVRGDRIILTKSDADAGGRHHSIPSRWIQSVDDKVTVRKTADEAKAHWRDEERGAFFGDDDRNRDEDSQGRILNRSFSGTY